MSRGWIRREGVVTQWEAGMTEPLREPLFSESDLRSGLALSNTLLEWLDHQPGVTLHEVAVAMMVVMVELGRRLDDSGMNGPAVVEVLARQAGRAVRVYTTERTEQGPSSGGGPVH